MARRFVALIVFAGCAKQGMSRDQACDLLTAAACGGVLELEATCPDDQLEIWDTPEWVDKHGTRSPHEECETLIANACCENAAGPKDCKQVLGVTSDQVVMHRETTAPSNDRPFRKQHERVVVDFDKLSKPLGPDLVRCARQATEKRACTPADLDWLVSCLGAGAR